VFRDRQILVRDGENVRCFKLKRRHQLAVVVSATACITWALVATIAYFDRSAALALGQDKIEHQAQELEGVKATYQAAFARLDDFQTVFSNVTCEIVDIQDSLMRFAQQSFEPVDGGVGHPTMPHLNPDVAGCRGSAAEKKELRTANADSPEQEVIRQRVARLELALNQLKASHGAFLQYSTDLAASRVGELERALNSVGVDAKALARTGDNDGGGKEHYGKGGPFVSTLPGNAPADGIDVISLFNTHVDRLDHLTRATRALPLTAPLNDYEVTSPFGARYDPINAMTGIHEGVDLGAPMGTPVLATGDGQVVWAGWRDRYGNLVEIDHGLGLQSRYAHLSRVLVNVGDTVQRGKPIGLLGSTGRSTGPHLHYEIRIGDQPTNPMKFITAGRDVFKE
jgi:murein DD-endopeptidase MepM/ murein hydrolase activator NlpD